MLTMLLIFDWLCTPLHDVWSIQSANALVHVATWVINHNSWYEHMLQ